MVLASEKEPSLHDLIEQWLERTPFLHLGGFEWWDEFRAAVASMLDGEEARIRAGGSGRTEAQLAYQLRALDESRASFDVLFSEEKYAGLLKRGERRFSHTALQAALLIMSYPEEPLLNGAHQLLAELTNVDEGLTTWRYRHALMVHRFVGEKAGTGGSSGFHYLRATAECVQC